MLFTNSYPYDFSAEHTFLAREIPYLASNFDRVIIVPRVSKGNRLPLPPNVEVDDSYSVYYKDKTNIFFILLHVFGSVSFYKEFRSHFPLLLNPFKLARLLLSLSRAEITRRWVENWMLSHHNDSEMIFYSYWFNDVVIGLGLVKKQHPQIKLVSRAHGYDIYEEMYFPYYWPLRKDTLAKLNKLFPASYNGRDYFRNRYPEFLYLFETLHLGVEDPRAISKPSVDGVFRIVSCAYIIPLKRVDLLLEAIAYAARMRPEQRFAWSHFGEGKDRTKLIKMVKNKFPHNAIGELLGYVPNQDILRHYMENPVDVFVNLSTTEGGAPVSIMEAISCGIPVIATSVGGNPEIVSERDGILLDPDPTPHEIANAIFVLLDNPELAAGKRRGSRKVWQESYNADVNFRLFAERLKSIREDP